MNKNFEIIKKVIHKILPESEIILFGSQARGDNTSFSDYDLLVVSNNFLSILQIREFKQIIRKELALYKIPIDIIIHNKEEIETKQKITGHIVKQAINEGVYL